MSNYVQHAVDSLVARYESELPGELDTIESEQGLVAGSMAEPYAYRNFQSPDDSHSPMLWFYESGFEADHQRTGVWIVNCVMVFGFTGDAGLGTNEDQVRRYVTALIRVVAKDSTLGGVVVQAAFRGGEAFQGDGESKATIRYRYGFRVDVMVHERES